MKKEIKNKIENLKPELRAVKDNLNNQSLWEKIFDWASFLSKLANLAVCLIALIVAVLSYQWDKLTISDKNRLNLTFASAIMSMFCIVVDWYLGRLEKGRIIKMIHEEIEKNK